MSNLSSSAHLLTLMSLIKLLARTRPQSGLRLSKWRKALNALAWLCDRDTAGKSVSSIAVEQSNTCYTMWLATNDSDLKGTMQHLIQLVDALANYKRQDWDLVQNHLATICVERSHNKVRNYVKILQRSIQLARRNLDDMDEETRRQDDGWTKKAAMLKILDTTFGQATSLITYCNAAYDFRQAEEFVTLCDIHKSLPSDYIWSAIYHHVGRLGAWGRASHTVTRYALGRTDFFKRCKVEVIGSPKVTLRQTTGPSPSLSRILPALIPDKTSAQLLSKLAKASGYDQSELQQKFDYNYRHKTVTDHVHSEIVIVEHFQQNGLSFAEDDRYIGCSKPSCYLCDKYLSWHCLHVAPRPCHNKLWMSWSLLETTETSAESSLQSRRRFLVDIAYRMEDDIRHSIMHGVPTRQDMYDSTADLSNSSRYTRRQPADVTFKE